MRRRLFVATLFGCLTLPWLLSFDAHAQTAPPTRIRGSIAAVDAETLTVNSRDGQTIQIGLARPLSVATVKKVDLASVGPNSYVGIATRTLPGGVLQAIEVLVFPEAMRGTAEGHFPWDLEPGSMMTNGTVTGAVQANTGRELNVRFKDSSNTIIVPPNVPVVTLAPAEPGDLKPGAKVFLSATRNPQGQLMASRVTVEKDGVAPPM